MTPIGKWLLMLAPGALAGSAFAQSSDIYAIDFNNYTYPWSGKVGALESDQYSWHWVSDVPSEVLALKSGSHAFEAGGYPDGYLKLISVTYGDLTGGGTADAAVDLHRQSGGTLGWDCLYVFHESAAGPTLLGVLRSGDRGHGGLVAVKIAGGQLIVDFADPALAFADCCSKGYVRIHYLYQLGKFVEVGARGRGSLPP
jgi:hypothetical protein